MTFSILVTAPTLGKLGLDRLREANCRVFFVNGGVAELNRLMASEPFDGVISRTLNLSQRAIDSCPSLKIISKHGAGVNNIDVKAATARGIPVFYTPGANATSVAELTIGLMVAVARKITHHDKALHSGGWTRSNDGLQLAGRTLALIGVGEIGSQVGAVAQAMGMKVIAYDPFVKSSHFEMNSSLTDLLAKADVLSIHCPLTDKTNGLIGEAQIKTMRPSAIVINTSRAGIVDELAMAAAVKNGALAGAALDVFASEPPDPNSPLLAEPSIIMTPHIGGSTIEALNSVALAAAETAIHYLRGQPVNPAYCVNPVTLQSPQREAAL